MFWFQDWTREEVLLLMLAGPVIGVPIGLLLAQLKIFWEDVLSRTIRNAWRRLTSKQVSYREARAHGFQPGSITYYDASKDLFPLKTDVKKLEG
jgi:hypothetical protein